MVQGNRGSVPVVDRSVGQLVEHRSPKTAGRCGPAVFVLTQGRLGPPNTSRCIPDRQTLRQTGSVLSSTRRAGEGHEICALPLLLVFITCLLADSKLWSAPVSTVKESGQPASQDQAAAPRPAAQKDSDLGDFKQIISLLQETECSRQGERRDVKNLESPTALRALAGLFRQGKKPHA